MGPAAIWRWLLVRAPPSDSAAEAPARQGPPYSLGACPAPSDGANTSPTGEASYQVTLDLPDDPQGAPVVFVWHWLGGSAAQAARAMQLEAVRGGDDVIFVLPDSSGSPDERRFTARAEGNPDLLLFDDQPSCLHQQLAVDLDRVSATGMSAGGLWTSDLTLHRAEWLSATAPLSGGTLPGGYETPAAPIPVLLTWGGPSDTYSTLSFDDTTRDMMDRRRADGPFVVACEHDRGHTLPPGGIAYAYRSLMDHPTGVSPEPYAGSRPSGFPSWCAQPAALHPPITKHQRGPPGPLSPLPNRASAPPSSPAGRTHRPTCLRPCRCPPRPRR